MAQRRMLDKKISVSEQVANLEPVGQLIFTWSIAHTDDVGVLPGNLRALKALLVPHIDLSLDEFDRLVAAICEQGLWEPYEFSSKSFYRLPQFFASQTLKKDRQPQTILPVIIFKDPKETWKLLEDIGFQNGSTLETEEKRREEKKDIGVADAPAAPVFERKIRDKDEEYRGLVKDLAAHDYLSTTKINQIVLEEFLPYWLERSEGAKKSRWEKEKAFEYQRRIRTWLKNFHRKDYTCSQNMWHKEGERCYCERQEPVFDYKSLPVSEFAKSLNKRV